MDSRTRSAGLMRIAMMAVVLTAAGRLKAADEGAMSAPEEHVKAAFLLNFLRFIEWNETPSTGPLVVTLLGNTDDIAARVLEGKMIRGRRIEVHRAKKAEAGGEAHMIFVGERDASRAASIVHRIHCAHAVLVGEAPGFLNAGGTVNFVREGDHVSFEINPRSTQETAFRISSKLLRLAHNLRWEDTQ